MSYREEFPDYADTLPTIAGLADESWRNDTCPVLRDPTGTIELFCDYAEASDREFPESPRYTLIVGDNAGIESETLSETFLDAVAKAIAALEA